LIVCARKSFRTIIKILSHILQKLLLYKLDSTEKINKLIDGYSIKALISKTLPR